LREEHGSRVALLAEDVRDVKALRSAVREAHSVFHFAAQVAVTTSLDDPGLDFEINAVGTFNLLQVWRELSTPPPLLYTSTNKVYGGLGALATQAKAHRYEPAGVTASWRGIDEAQPLEFYSPYGCSKGTADQYVLDHAKTFGLPAMVFRMSCIYGPHQFGTEDQGWVAHFLLRAQAQQELAIYGDGRQVRDILYVDDLVEAFLLARARMRRLAGNAYNIGGGAGNSVSLLELIHLIEAQRGQQLAVKFHDWRPGDQRYYVTNFDKFHRHTGWQPRVHCSEGIGRLRAWLAETAASSTKMLTAV
jgi:CDP-paratose 2-epimerase